MGQSMSPPTPTKPHICVAYMQAQSAEKCAAQLKLARAAAGDAKAASEAAANAAADASRAVKEAQPGSDTAACAAAQASATAAADKAAQSGTFATCLEL